MSNWIIHFLISNIFICIFTLVIIGTKKLLKKYLSATTQYHLCFLLFLLLAVPFFPVQIHGSQLFSWLHFFQTDSGLNSGTDTLSELTSNTQNILTVAIGIMLGTVVTLTSIGAGALGTVTLFFLYPLLPTPKLVGTEIAHAVPLTLVAGIGHASMGNLDLVYYF